jgi:RecJ-like exonuclease
MTTDGARQKLAGKLVFAKPALVEAVRFLRDVETARERIATCRHERCPTCEGSGSTGATGICEYCGGDGTALPCHCFDGLMDDAIVEARRIIARFQRRGAAA